MTELVDELVEAVCQSQNATLKQLLEESANPNAVYYGCTLLAWSAEADNLEGAQVLIDAGANTCGEYSDSSPLCLAIMSGSIPMIKLLVENGADFLLHEGLITAIEKGTPGLVKYLLELGADINTPNSKSETPIACALREENWEIVKLLCENGVDVNMTDSSGETSLIKFVRMKNLPMIEYLLQKKVDLDKKNNRNETALTVAWANEDFHTFRILIESGANSDITDSDGDSPLVKFTRTMNLPMIKYLLGKKVNLNQRNNKNETALSVSLANNDFRTFKLLIDSGADPKLASQAIEDKIKTNPRFADYMSKVKMADSKIPHTDQKKDLKKAQAEVTEDDIQMLSARFTNTQLSGQEAAPNQFQFR